MSTGEVNPTELIASLINHKATIVEACSMYKVWSRAV